MHRVKYDAVLYGLLHDIGKPLLRYSLRASENLEEHDAEIIGYVKNVKNHDEIRDIVLKEVLGVNPASYKQYEETISQADEMAAMERGLENTYSKLLGVWGRVESKLSQELGVFYRHYMVPILSPSWLLLKTTYKNSLGPCATSSFKAEDVWRSIGSELKRLIEALNKGDPDEVSRELRKILEPLKNEPVWYPPTLLNGEILLKITSYDYISALKWTSYYSIAKYLLDSLKLLRETYGFSNITRGLINTTLEALKYSLLLVPSAVYLSITPDISLYSHTKLVSAYVAALSTGASRLKLMLLDARGVQDFISAPVKAKAASRVIRGRSLIAELVATSLANYVLELYGGLPNTNVLTSEGGSLMLLVPQTSSEEYVNQVLENVVKKTHERLKGLWFTVAYSKPFTLEDTKYVTALANLEGKVGFPSVLESLEEELAFKKSVDSGKMVFNIDEDRIRGFDAITQEPVVDVELKEGYYGLEVSQDNKDYADRISGFKLDPGEIISETTHLSLVAGTCNRNMIYLISIYLYEVGGDQNVVKPSEESINILTKNLAERLSREDKRGIVGNRLLFDLSEAIDGSTYDLSVGLVPLPTTGSLHIVVSVRDVISDNHVRVSSDLIGKVLTIIRESLNRINTAGGRLLTRVDLRVVNTASEFIEALSSKDFRKHVKGLLEDGVDVSLGVFYTGTYHPVVSKLEPSRQTPVLTLADLDEYPLVGIAKIDGDELGEVKKLISFSPSRLVTFSDLLTVLLNTKTQLLSQKYSMSLGAGSRGPIMLYAGGDDIAFYGHWVDVVKFLYYLYNEVVKSMHPLSFSSAVVIEASDYPILEFYDKVVEALRAVKSEGKGGVVIEPFASPRIVKCGDLCKLVRAMSVWRDQAGWPPPPTSLASLEGLYSVLSSSDLSKLGDYKREIQLLSTMAALNIVELKALCGNNEERDGLYQLVRREVAYSYISSRREKELESLSSLLKQMTGQPETLYHVPGEDIRASLTRVVEAKTSLDLLLILLRVG